MTGEEESARIAVAEERFRMLVESVRDYAIFMLDPTGHVATWNAGARLIKGYRRSEIVGKHISVFYTEEDRVAGRAETLLAIATREGRVEDEGWRVRKDGTQFWADVVITTLRDGAGELVGFAKVTRDLTLRRELEERLRESEERFATTLFSIGDAVLATDERGRITVLNRVAEQLTGWSAADAAGRDIDEVFCIINEQTRQPAANPVRRVLAEGVIVGLANHTALIARDGSECPIADSGAPIRDARGATLGAVLVFRDVTEERRAEEELRQSEARLRLMIESVRDYAIYMLDTEGRVVSWNAGTEALTGYRADEIVGESFSRFFTPEDVASGKPQRELDIAVELGRFEDDAWRVRKDGTRFWATVCISAVRDATGTLIGFTKVTRDLTERRHAEEERLRLAQTQEAVRMRDEFLSIASHELKTPLTALQLQLQAILDRKEALDEKSQGKLAKAVRASERLGDLIESLLDVSRIATGTIRLESEEFDLAAAVREVIERLREAATRARCDMTLQAESAVRGRWDRLRIEQLLTNLLSNAFRHAAGTPVAVSVVAKDREAVLEVRDAGPGIAQRDLSRVFGRFERGGPASYGGLGLGLYVARQIAEAHGGTITAESTEGARFIVTLPLRRM